MLGGIVGGIVGLAGDLLGRREDRKINDANVAMQREINAENIAFQREAMERNEALQREFAKMGIRWKVEDAQAAGLHPLSALGTSTSTYSPTIVTPSSQAAEQRSTGHHFANMGQSLANAIRALTPEERLRRLLETQRLAADTQKTFAEASYWASESARARTQALATAKALADGDDGGSEFDAVEHAVATPTSHDSVDPSREAGEHSFWRRYKLRDGSYIDLPSQEAAEALENIHVTGIPIAYRWLRQRMPGWAPLRDQVRRIREVYSQ